MRINMSLERYDVKALDEIYHTVDKLNNQSEILESMGIFLKNRLVQSSEEFASINYVRIYEAAVDFLEKMKLMREELTELCKSCRDLAEKIAEIWA